MNIRAQLSNSHNQHHVTVATNENEKTIDILSKPGGYGSSINGGELLFLSLATCFCNDIYREAGKRNLNIQSVNVTVSGEFGLEGEPAKSISYSVNIVSEHSAEEIQKLITEVDRIAEIHNTLRKGIDVTLDTTN